MALSLSDGDGEPTAHYAVCKPFSSNADDVLARDRSDGDRITFLTPEEKYEAMRQRIPLSTELQPLVTNDRLEFYELQAMPDNWIFNAKGDWVGYRVRMD